MLKLYYGNPIFKNLQILYKKSTFEENLKSVFIRILIKYLIKLLRSSSKSKERFQS